MEGIDCFVCFIPFSDNLVPKTLECGHSLCSPCITRLLEGKSECPKCRRKMTMKNVAQYSTAYDLLNLINSVNKSKVGKDGLNLRTATLKRKFEDKLNSLAEEENVMAKRLTKERTFLQDGLSKLEDHEQVDSGDVTKSKQMVVKLEKEFLKIGTNITDFQESIKIEDFATCKQFLQEIYARVQKGGKVFAIHRIRNEMNYGQILGRDNKLLVHSLSKPNEEEGQLTVVKFGDIKQCFQGLQVRPFLTLYGNEVLQQTVFIDTTEDPRVALFVMFCSGEAGCSYKGSSTQEGKSNADMKGILSVSSCAINGVVGKTPFNYIPSGQQVLTECDCRDVVVKAGGNVGFALKKMTGTYSKYDIIGKVTLSPYIYVEEAISSGGNHINKIVDCGLSLAVM